MAEVYGDCFYITRKNVIFCFQHCCDKHGNQTLSIEPAVERNDNKKLIFTQKRIQVSRLELPELGKVLLKFEKSMEGKFHGDHNNSYAFKWTTKDVIPLLYLETIIENKKSYVKLEKSEVFYLTNFTLNQLKGYCCTHSDVMNLLKLN